MPKDRLAGELPEVSGGFDLLLGDGRCVTSWADVAAAFSTQAPTSIIAGGCGWSRSNWPQLLREPQGMVWQLSAWTPWSLQYLLNWNGWKADGNLAIRRRNVCVCTLFPACEWMLSYTGTQTTELPLLLWNSLKFWKATQRISLPSLFYTQVWIDQQVVIFLRRVW